jgi:hypothetical protein
MIRTRIGHRRSARTCVALALLAGWAAGAWADRPAEVRIDEPSEYGIRFTPEMARGIAREFVRNEVIRRYEVDSDREDEIAELVARRMMEALHEIDTPQTQAAVERLTGNFFRMAIESQRMGMGRLHTPPEVGKALARDVLPLMPNIHELVRKVGKDIRPMLPLKQQLRLAADLMTVKTAMDGFETTMQRWSRGEVNPGEDPFGGNDHQEPDLGPEGVSEHLKQAREASLQGDRLGAFEHSWERYVLSAGEFYGFDESQMATARSVVRETVARAKVVLEKTEFKVENESLHLWNRLLESLGREYQGDVPVRFMLIRRVLEVNEPLTKLNDEMRQRVDRIAREEQRRAAEERMRLQLMELGFEQTEDTSTARARANE